ncbi:unnamed protein product [Candidula unifasciata]|uniref:Secreted protein n=1 Tax=Candidula unifasciata TaxID=100452 RepID=A0A8S3YFZ8_9EUPU|nr:unnamed protein product [Candidula unifasciata]
MKTTLILSLIALASIQVVKADIDYSLAWKYYLWNQALQAANQTFCSQISCYPNWQCLQKECGYQGQTCGVFIGECCYNYGLVCQPYYAGDWEGVCVPGGQPVA